MAADESDSRWEEAEQLGPYRLHEQVPQSAKDLGELFRATNETTGATALVFKPSATNPVRLSNWKVRCISSGEPRYMALEVEDSKWSFSSETHSMEELVVLFEDVRDEVRGMAQQLPTEPGPRSRRPLMWVAGTLMVCTVAFALGRLAAALMQPNHLGAPAGEAPAHYGVSTNIETPPATGNSWVLGIADGGQPPVSHPFPPKPYKGQKRPPCTPRVEVEIIGACWVPHELKAPCPEELYEYQGRCYTTSMIPPAQPQSLDP